MCPLWASFGCHHHMFHIFWRRGPSQKLSKPVPKNGLSAMLRTWFQMSVRPVRVEFLPRVPRRPPPEPENRANEETATMANTRACTNAGIRRTQAQLVTKINVPAMRKQDKDVAELDSHRSQNTIARRAPSATSCPFLRVPSSARRILRKRHIAPRPITRVIMPNRFLLVVTPVYITVQNPKPGS